MNYARTICRKYAIEMKEFHTKGKNDEKHLKEEIEKFNPDRIASVGGDGTTLFTAITLLNTGIPMGIIPLGSANGMATELFVNTNPPEALRDLIMSQIISGLDMVVVNEEHYSIHIGDVGINAQIVASYSKDKRRGMATYARYFIEELLKMKPFDVSIKIRDKVHQEKGVMVGICNARKYGTGVPLNVSGNPMDGKFEIVLVRKISVDSLIKSGLSKFDERFIDSQSGRVFSTRNAEIEFSEPRLLQLDGEVIGEFDKLDVKVLEGAVRLITTRENIYLKK